MSMGVRATPNQSRQFNPFLMTLIVTFDNGTFEASRRVKVLNRSMAHLRQHVSVVERAVAYVQLGLSRPISCHKASPVAFGCGIRRYPGQLMGSSTNTIGVG